MPGDDNCRSSLGGSEKYYQFREGKQIEKLSVFIIVKNEEKGIRRTLDSVAWADEIVVVDSGSTDHTEDICREYTDRFIYNEWPGWGRQKQFAMEQCQNNWVLSIDADEVIAPELRKSIEAALADPKYDGYKMLRRNYYQDKVVSFGCMVPKPALRLVRKDKSRFSDTMVHEKLLVNGKVGWLEGYLDHYNIDDISEWIEKNIGYSIVAAHQNFERGNRIGFKDFAGLPWLFLKRYILLRGFLYGVPGLAFSVLPVYYKLVRFFVTWELQQKKKDSGKEGSR